LYIISFTIRIFIDNIIKLGFNKISSLLLTNVSAKFNLIIQIKNVFTLTREERLMEILCN
jgi:hypothetical protein